MQEAQHVAGADPGSSCSVSTAPKRPDDTASRERGGVLSSLRSPPRRRRRARAATEARGRPRCRRRAGSWAGGSSPAAAMKRRRSRQPPGHPGAGRGKNRCVLNSRRIAQPVVQCTLGLCNRSQGRSLPRLLPPHPIGARATAWAALRPSCPPWRRTPRDRWCGGARPPATRRGGRVTAANGSSARSGGPNGQASAPDAGSTAQREHRDRGALQLEVRLLERPGEPRAVAGGLGDLDRPTSTPRRSPKTTGSTSRPPSPVPASSRRPRPRRRAPARRARRRGRAAAPARAVSRGVRSPAARPVRARAAADAASSSSSKNSSTAARNERHVGELVDALARARGRAARRGCTSR